MHLGIACGAGSRDGAAVDAPGEFDRRGVHIVAPREILAEQILAVIGLRRQAPEVAAGALDHETVDSRLDRLLQGERVGFVGRDPRLDFEQFLECDIRSEEHTSELQSLMRISYAVFCLKKKKKQNK